MPVANHAGFSPGGLPGRTIWVVPVGRARDWLGSARAGAVASRRQPAKLRGRLGGLSPGRKGHRA
jgi:hypothetical protein